MGVFGGKKKKIPGRETSVKEPKSIPTLEGPRSFRIPRVFSAKARFTPRGKGFGSSFSPTSIAGEEDNGPGSSDSIERCESEYDGESIHHSVKSLPVLSPTMAAIAARTMASEVFPETPRSGNDLFFPQRSDASALPDRIELPKMEKSPNAVIKRISAKKEVNLTENWIIDLNDLIIGRTIGHSSFGTVNEGKLNGTKVAVKTIEHGTDPAALDNLETIKKEAELNCKLRHPNIVLFMGICVHPTKVCIVTELMARGNVRDLLVGIVKGKSIRLDWSLRLQWALDTAQGMAYLHSLNPPMIHRDLKTTNLLVDRGMNVKICDFGLSRFRSDKMMSAVGTVHFAAPEILQNEKYTEKVDIFSYGTVLWEIYCRNCVFKGMAQIEIYNAVVNGDMPDVDVNCDSRYRAMMWECWAKNPVDRPTFRDIIDRLSMLVDELEDEADE